MQHNEHQEMGMESEVTTPQLVAVTLLTLFFLAVGIFLAALYGNLYMHP